MPEKKPTPALADIENIALELYIPFAEIPRAIIWPTDPTRMENDAEHSLGLAMIAGPMAARLGMDPYKATALAVWHDMVERYAGDTSVWADQTALDTKTEREKLARQELRKNFPEDKWMLSLIDEYEGIEELGEAASEEVRFIKALDKVHALLMIVSGSGEFWKQKRITFEMHLAKLETTRPVVALHPAALDWYDELCLRVAANPAEYFYNPKHFA